MGTTVDLKLYTSCDSFNIIDDYDADDNNFVSGPDDANSVDRKFTLRSRGRQPESPAIDV